MYVSPINYDQELINIDYEPIPVTCNRALEYTRVDGTCNQYYKCILSDLIVFSCNSGYQFDSLSRQCRPAAEVNCVLTDWKGTDDQTITVYW